MIGQEVSPLLRRRLTAVLLVGAVLISALALAACGGSGSGKPAYCSKIEDLKKSVTDLADIKVVQGGATSVRDAFDKVRSNADAAIAAVKSDFEPQTTALSSSISDLSHSVNQLSSSPLTAATAIPGEVSAVATAVTNLVDKTRSHCS